MNFLALIFLAEAIPVVVTNQPTNTVTLLYGIISILITQIGGIILAWMTSRRNNADVKETAKVITAKQEEVKQEVKIKTDALIDSSKAIHRRVDGNLTDMKAQLEIERARNVKLEDMLVRFMEFKDEIAKRLTASAAVSAARSTDPSTVPIHTFDPQHPEETTRILTPKKPTP